jgi:hypothetical protein
MTWNRKKLKMKTSSMWNGKQNHEKKEIKGGKKRDKGEEMHKRVWAMK